MLRVEPEEEGLEKYGLYLKGLSPLIS